MSQTTILILHLQCSTYITLKGQEFNIYCAPMALLLRCKGWNKWRPILRHNWQQSTWNLVVIDFSACFIHLRVMDLYFIPPVSWSWIRCAQWSSIKQTFKSHDWFYVIFFVANIVVQHKKEDFWLQLRNRTYWGTKFSVLFLLQWGNFSKYNISLLFIPICQYQDPI